MKKIIFIALTAMTAIGLASCNREEIAPPENGIQGKYLLTELTASTGEDDTKTNIQSNSVVVWSADDHIAVKGTDGVLHYYKLKYGADTPVGKFVPAAGQTPATYNLLSDLTAIYPACAAELSGGELYVNINNQDLRGNFSEKGLSSWNADSPFTFKNNDIKVSKPGDTSQDSNGKISFKFKQLGTCCNFIIDFTQAEQAVSLAMESVERIQITTLEGVALGGRAKVTGTSLGVITNPLTNIDWTVVSTRSMSKLIQPMFVFYPEVTTNTTLKITLTTTEHEFVFTGRPTQNFEAGKRLTFPITVDKNFTRSGSELAYTSSLRTDVDQFYYYGGTNCLLLAQTNMTGTLDVTQYVTDSRWHNTKNRADVKTLRPAVYAKIIWSEGADVIASATVNGSAYGYKLKLAGSAAGATDAISTDANGKSTLTIKRGSGSGNALVGIYDSSNRLLWSYHIWCPDHDPTENMPVYTQTNSGSYTVMTMPIGAITRASAGMDDPQSAAGLYYQWGRKDPLGRPSNFDSTGGGGIMDVKGADQSTALNIGDSEYEITGGNLKNCRIWLSDSGNSSPQNNALKLAWDVPNQPKSLTRFVLDYTVAKPWMFIYCGDPAFSSGWCSADPYFWGNGKGSQEFPLMEETYKSIFDPSPEGFRVAPEDLYAGFTATRNNENNTEQFNIASVEFSKGWTLYYQGWKTGPTDYYLAQGQRNRNSTSLSNVGTACSIWTSSPTSNKEVGSQFYFTVNRLHPFNTGAANALGFPVRCVQEP